MAGTMVDAAGDSDGVNLANVSTVKSCAKSLKLVRFGKHRGAECGDFAATILRLGKEKPLSLIRKR
jgi:hypothetical protein